MKKIYALFFACMLTVGALYAQKQYDCYHIQEFMYNSKTQAYDLPVERSDFSKFTINEQSKSLTQHYEDGTSNVLPIRAISTDDKQSTSYQVISPANGYTYVYRVVSASAVIEVRLVQNGKETLLKKYLYRS